MQPNGVREEKPSQRSDASPADNRRTRRRAVDHLDARTARAVSSLFAIEQTHLSEFHNE